MSDTLVSIAAAAHRIDAVLNQTRADYMYPAHNTTLSIPGPGRTESRSGSDQQQAQREALLTFGQFDARRNAPPLAFTEYSTKCFCDWRHETPDLNFPISATSSVFLRTDRAHQFANACGPEPLEQHYVEMLELACAMASPAITVVNLAGSGASVPQHFHTQIYPLVREQDGARSDNSLGRLWQNLAVSDPVVARGGVEVREVTFPLWGVRISFSSEYEPATIGRLLYDWIHVNLRYRSQLMLTYNVYIDSRAPRTLTILFRESRKESVFQLDEVLQWIAEVDSPAASERVAASPNRWWRWAWLECIGGFPARDDSFANPEVYNWEFWTRIWELISLPIEYRSVALERIVASAETLKPRLDQRG